jgi:superfamily II DNA or RNA helicase
VIYKHFQQNANCKHLGVTATPKRHDEFAMEQVFESVAYNYGIEEAVIDGWLVPVRQHVVKVEDLDFSSIRTTAGDFNERDLEAVMLQEKVLHAIASPAVELCGDRPTLVFCVTVAHAERITEILNRYKKGSAEWLCGETPKDERRAKVQDFKDGKTQYLCNCGLFLEGFDAPNTANIVMGRPTKSLPLYTQVIGRGTRALPGVIDPFAEGSPEQRKAAILASGKPFMTIFDFAGNAGRHKLISAADILGGKWGVPVRERAKKVAEEEGESGMMVDDALEAASDELELLKEQQEIRRRAEIKAKATYQSYNVNAFDKSDSHSSHTQSTVGKEPPTEKQIWKLKSLGVKESTAREYSKKQASAVISSLLEKQNGGD